MENEDRRNNAIRYAIDAEFSGVVVPPELYRHVFQQVKGEIKVKKISFALVIVMLSMLLIATAIAASVWNTFFEPVVSIETENGSFSTWPLQEKLKLLDLMQQNGIELPEEAMKQLSDDTITDDKKEQIVTEIIVDRYGREDAISHISIMEDVKGMMETWSLEDKAWYSQVMQKYDRLGGDPQINILPGENDLSEEEVLQIAAKALADARGIPMDTLDLQGANVWFYLYPANDVDNPRWLMEFAGYPSILLTASGEPTEDPVMGILTPEHAAQQEAIMDQKEEERRKTIAEMEQEKGPMHTWSLQDKLVISPDYRLPTKDDLPEQEAIAKAKEALIQAYGIEESVLDQYTPYVWLERGYRNREKDTWDYWYRIDFGTIDRPHNYGVLMISDTGEILETYEPSDTLKSSG